MFSRSQFPLSILALLLVLAADPALGAEDAVLSAQNTNRVSFYFGAHSDDWQLFLNPNAYYDAQNPSNKVVFVYVTAGDAGLGLGNGGRSQPYYLARENGAKLSVQFIANASKPPDIPIDSVASISSHPIKKWLYRMDCQPPASMRVSPHPGALPPKAPAE